MLDLTPRFLSPQTLDMSNRTKLWLGYGTTKAGEPHTLVQVPLNPRLPVLRSSLRLRRSGFTFVVYEYFRDLGARRIPRQQDIRHVGKILLRVLTMQRDWEITTYFNPTAGMTASRRSRTSGVKYVRRCPSNNER